MVCLRERSLRASLYSIGIAFNFAPNKITDRVCPGGPGARTGTVSVWLEQFKSVLNFDGGDLETAYNALNAEYEDSVSAAEEISDRIDSVESVAEALFTEWQAELDEYTSASLRRDSERQLRATRGRYERLMTSMRGAERSIDPVLASLKDNVLYLKHNLNARAIASLRGELASVNSDVTRLLEAMNAAINESNEFIAELRSSGA